MEANSTESKPHLEINTKYFDVMEIVQLSIAPVGIIGNLTVIVVFLKDRKLRNKIPKRFIVNQVMTNINVLSVFLDSYPYESG